MNMVFIPWSHLCHQGELVYSSNRQQEHSPQAALQQLKVVSRFLILLQETNKTKQTSYRHADNTNCRGNSYKGVCKVLLSKQKPQCRALQIIKKKKKKVRQMMKHSTLHGKVTLILMRQIFEAYYKFKHPLRI